MGRIRRCRTETHTAEAPGAVYAHVQLRQVSHACALAVGTFSTSDPLLVSCVDMHALPLGKEMDGWRKKPPGGVSNMACYTVHRPTRQRSHTTNYGMAGRCDMS